MRQDEATWLHEVGFWQELIWAFRPTRTHCAGLCGRMCVGVFVIEQVSVGTKTSPRTRTCAR